MEEVIKAQKIDIKKAVDGNYEISLLVNKESINPISKTTFYPKSSSFIVTINEEEKAKSAKSNATLWFLCEEIAKKTGRITKVDVYKKIISEVGKVDIRSYPKEEFLKEKNLWEKLGKGWITEILEETEDEVEAFFYYGSSVYTQFEMNRVLDYAIEEAENLGIYLKRKN